MGNKQSKKRKETNQKELEETEDYKFISGKHFQTREAIFRGTFLNCNFSTEPKTTEEEDLGLATSTICTGSGSNKCDNTAEDTISIHPCYLKSLESEVDFLSNKLQKFINTAQQLGMQSYFLTDGLLETMCQQHVMLPLLQRLQRNRSELENLGNSKMEEKCTEQDHNLFAKANNTCTGPQDDSSFHSWELVNFEDCLSDGPNIGSLPNNPVRSDGYLETMTKHSWKEILELRNTVSDSMKEDVRHTCSTELLDVKNIPLCNREGVNFEHKQNHDVCSNKPENERDHYTSSHLSSHSNICKHGNVSYAPIPFKTQLTKGFLDQCSVNGSVNEANVY